MAKYYGKIGFVSAYSETSPGVHKETVTERSYKGDILRISRGTEQGDKVNPNLSISNRISIVADAFATQNLVALRYIHWMGTRWIVTKVEVQRPRLILSIGGVYNGE